jgi:hypothetical protein
MNLNLDLRKDQKVKRCGSKECNNVLVLLHEFKQNKCRYCQREYAKKRYLDKKNGTYKPRIRGRKTKNGAHWAKHDSEAIGRPFPFRFIKRAVRDSEYLVDEHLFIFDRFMERQEGYCEK